MKKLIISALFLLPLLIGCAVSPKIPPTTQVHTQVVVDSALLQPCPSLPLLDTDTSYETLAAHYITTIGLYGECAIRHRSAAQALRNLTTESTP